MINIYPIVVIYNQELIKSEAVRYFLTTDNENLFIIDNSTNLELVNKNIDYCLGKKIHYYQMKGNVGLSKAYNFIIKQIPKDKNNYLLISDQDTMYEKNFINEISSIINNNLEKNIFVPIILDKKAILSPCKIQGKSFKHSKFTNFNRNINNYSFINSGMIINSLVFNEIQYDETMFLDFVDHDFVKQAKMNDFSFFVMQEVKLFQNFSGVQKNSFQNDLIRYKIFIHDGIKYYEKWFKSSIFKFSTLIKRMITLTIIHRRKEFITLLFEELKK